MQLDQIPPAPPQARTQVRHTTATMHLARQLYGDGDAWTPTQIVRYLKQTGVQPVPTEGTVRRWVIPASADEHRELNARLMRGRRAAAKPAPTAPPACESVEERLSRLRVLRDAGMSYSGISVVARVDFGLEITDDVARYVLRARRLTPTIRRHLTTRKEAVA